MPQPHDAWQNYRQRRMRLVWVALGGLILLGLSFLPARTRHSAKPVLAGFALFTGTTLWASLSLSAFPCPHCGKPFTHDETIRDDFTRACVHCQRPKWSNPGPGRL
jgi:predicted RNA-binding Zn-ribbon protein involved in translation (DUF1610 family)